MRLDSVLARIDSLRPMPAVAVQLLNAAQDPDVDLAHVARWIEHDAGMTANLLRYCNSPLYGLWSQIASVRQAVSVIGMKQVIQMALTALSSRYLSPSQPGYALAPGDLWKNSVAAAIASELLASETKYPNPATAYTAALLQDIGKVVLAEFIADSRPSPNEVGEGLSFDEVERELTGASHAEVGALLLTRWGFPDALVESVKFHHAPAGASIDPALAKLSHGADALTMTAGIGIGADGLLYRLDEEALRDLGVTGSERFQTLMEKFALRLRKAEALFALGSYEGEDASR